MKKKRERKTQIKRTFFFASELLFFLRPNFCVRTFFWRPKSPLFKKKSMESPRPDPTDSTLPPESPRITLERVREEKFAQLAAKRADVIQRLVEASIEFDTLVQTQASDEKKAVVERKVDAIIREYAVDYLSADVSAVLRDYLGTLTRVEQGYSDLVESHDSSTTRIDALAKSFGLVNSVLVDMNKKVVELGRVQEQQRRQIESLKAAAAAASASSQTVACPPVITTTAAPSTMSSPSHHDREGDHLADRLAAIRQPLVAHTFDPHTNTAVFKKSPAPTQKK